VLPTGQETAIEPARRFDDVEQMDGQRRRCDGFQRGQVTLWARCWMRTAYKGRVTDSSIPVLIIPHRDGETMARRFYTRDDLERVKQSVDALRDELEPARKHPGRGERLNYVCPACGRDGKVRVFVGNKDGAAVWSCIHASCGRAGNIVDLYMIRDGLTAGEATTAVCDKWADRLGRPATASSGQRSRPQAARRPGAVLPAGEPAAASRASTSSTSTASSSITATVASLDDDLRRERQRYCIAAAARLWDASGKRARDYLHGRGFTDDTLQRFHVGYDAQCKVGGSLKYGRASIVIPYSRRLDYYAARFLKPIVGQDGDVTKCLNCPGSEPVFNAAALWAGYDAVVVVEGWADALSIAQAAATISTATVGAISINGAMNHGRVLDLLASRPTQARLLLALDDDGSGQDGARVLSEKLDSIGQRHELINSAAVWGVWMTDDGHKCKDANDLLQHYGNDGLAVSIETMLDEPAVRLYASR